MHKVDVNVKIFEDQQKQNDSSLTLNIFGDSIDNSVVNALRRVILAEIPTYGFYKSYMEIEKNTSIFNNDQMRLRLGMIPIPKLASKVEFLEEKHFPYTSGVYGSIYPDKEIVKHPDDHLDIHFYINASNPEQEELHVTTNDCKVYINMEEKTDVYDTDNPLLIIKLRRNEEFKCHLTAKLGIAKLNNCWSCVGTCYFDRISDNAYNFMIESLGQMSETVIFQKACRIVLIRLERAWEYIKTLPKSEANKMMIKLTGESHTIGNLLATSLLRHSKVIDAGYKVAHPSVDEVILNIETDKIKPEVAINETMEYLKELFEKLSKSLGHKNDKDKEKIKKKSKGGKGKRV